MKNKDYLLFDLDGTLTDPKEGITKAVQYALKHYGIQVDDLDCLKTASRNIMIFLNSRQRKRSRCTVNIFPLQAGARIKYFQAFRKC